MTVMKTKSELRTILDFSTGKCSKNYIRNSLRNCSITNLCENENERTLYFNEIKIGMYSIMLLLPFDSSTKWNKLRDYGDFEVKIYDSKTSAIDLKKDGRFNNQYWVHKNCFGQLRIKHLVDIITYCYRLNNLNAFL